MGRFMCNRCARVYDPQAARCPSCGDPTALNQMWHDQGGKGPAISARAWRWGIVLSLAAWLIFAAVIVYFTRDG